MKLGDRGGAWIARGGWIGAQGRRTGRSGSPTPAVERRKFPAVVLARLSGPGA